ncbi:hypothetical protein ACFSTC_06365 [Nonomuraea ferruginea]
MISRARHLLAAAVSGALLMLPAFTGSANAAAASHVFHVSLAKTKADVQKVADYWKPEKLKKADSYTPPPPPHLERLAEVRHRGRRHGGQPADHRPAQGGLARSTPWRRRRAGPARPARSSSGSAPRSTGARPPPWRLSNHSVVATAAHCAYDARQGKEADSWIFVPEPGADGTTPHGIYVGSPISMHEDWARQERLRLRLRVRHGPPRLHLGQAGQHLRGQGRRLSCRTTSAGSAWSWPRSRRSPRCTPSATPPARSPTAAGPSTARR